MARIPNRLIRERLGGSSIASPITSVMKPGVIRKAPPKMTRTPSWTSRCGIRPSESAWLKRLQTARPCERSSIEPMTESAASSRIVQITPMASPTFRIT